MPQPQNYGQGKLAHYCEIDDAVEEYDIPYELKRRRGYRLVARLVNDDPSLDATYKLKINGALMAGTRQFITSKGSNTISNRGSAIPIGKTPAGTCVTAILEIPFLQLGADRILDYESKDWGDAGNFEHKDGGIIITTPANNIVMETLGLHSDRPLGIGANSIIKLTELP